MTLWLGYCPSAELWLRAKDSQRLSCTCHHLQCPVAFSVVRVSAASRSREGQLGLSYREPQAHPHLPARRRACAAGAATAFLSRRWDSLSLPQLISFANVCVPHYAKCHSRETRTPKGSLCWERVEKECDSCLRVCKGKGRKGRRKKKKKEGK